MILTVGLDKDLYTVDLFKDLDCTGLVRDFDCIGLGRILSLGLVKDLECRAG